MSFLFQVVQTQTRKTYCKNITFTGLPRLKYLFQVVQAQTKTAYSRILLTLDHDVLDIFSGKNHNSLL